MAASQVLEAQLRSRTAPEPARVIRTLLAQELLRPTRWDHDGIQECYPS